MGSLAVILLDTHIWIWLVSGDQRLSPEQQAFLSRCEGEGLGVSLISCWEVAKKVEKGKLVLDRPVERWIEEALAYPGVQLIGLTPRLVVASTQLPPPSLRDPAD
jgi:PIN domain nuclease of toxin-antitoxin system